jgi:hypothetical protein
MRTANGNGSGDLVMQAALPADAADPNGLRRNRLLRAMSPEDRAWLADRRPRRPVAAPDELTAARRPPLVRQ